MNILKRSRKLVLPPYDKKDSLIIAATVLVLIGLPLAVILFSQATNFFGRASGTTTIEAESGTLAGDATVIDDPNAAGGQYVKFGAMTSPTQTPDENCNNPLTITEGGTYTGCYVSNDSSLPAVKIATTQPVTLNRMTIHHAGVGVSYGVDRTNITIQNSTFTAIAPSIPQAEQQAVNLYKPNSIIIEHNRFQYGHGVQINGENLETNPLRITYNEFTDVSRLSQPIYYQGAIHFSKIQAPGGEILWNRVTNHYGFSWAEDVIALASTWGAQGNSIEVAYNLVNGAYPLTGDGSGFTGGAYDFGDITGGYIVGHHNYAVNYTNNGFMIPAGTEIYVRDSVAVYDGIADDGQRVSSVFGNGFTTYHGIDYPPHNGIGMSDNQSAHLRWTGSSWERADYYLPYGTNSNNQSLPTANSTAEQAAINEFEQLVVANGVTIGPLP